MKTYTVFAIDHDLNRNESHVLLARSAGEAVSRVKSKGRRRVVGVILGDHYDARARRRVR